MYDPAVLGTRKPAIELYGLLLCDLQRCSLSKWYMWRFTKLTRKYSRKTDAMLKDGSEIQCNFCVFRDQKDNYTGHGKLLGRSKNSFHQRLVGNEGEIPSTFGERKFSNFCGQFSSSLWFFEIFEQTFRPTYIIFQASMTMILHSISFRTIGQMVKKLPSMNANIWI